MINVLCVKWGTKYSSEDVNRLRAMVSKYLYQPFTFYCHTDDSAGVDAEIIPIEEDLEIYWNKLSMFQPGFVPTGDINLYFDLDIVIQNDITPLIEFLQDDLTMVRAYWKGELVTDGSSSKFKERWDMYANSSVLLWKNHTLHNIWEHFESDMDYWMIKYKGIDRFLFHEGFKLNWFPEGLIYSHRYEDYDPSKMIYLINGLEYPQPLVAKYLDLE